MPQPAAVIIHVGCTKRVFQGWVYLAIAYREIHQEPEKVKTLGSWNQDTRSTLTAATGCSWLSALMTEPFGVYRKCTWVVLGINSD